MLEQFLPDCPLCGEPMVRRTAQQGPRRGRDFWGCSAFRTAGCRGVINIDDVTPTVPVAPGLSPPATRQGQTPPTTLAPESKERQSHRPVTAAAEPRFAGWQHAFFQTAALLPSVVSALRLNGTTRKLVRSFAQWRLDFQGPTKPLPGPDVVNVLSVAESILARGSVPYCPEDIEDWLSSGDAPTPVTTEAELRTAVLFPTCQFVPARFDSAEEGQFYNWLTTGPLASARGWCVIPQLHLASLGVELPPETQLRADFVVVPPDAPPVVIEVDGAQHTSQVAQDRLRDAAIEQRGIGVVRVPVAEVRAGSGASLRRIESLVAACSTARPGTEGTVQRWTKWLHQCELAALTALKNGWLPVEGPWRVAVALPRALRNDADPLLLVSLALDHLAEMVWRLSRLHGVPASRASVDVLAAEPAAPAVADILIGPADGSSDPAAVPGDLARLLVSDLHLPVEFAAPATGCSPSAAPNPLEEDAVWFLSYIFRKPSFLEGQWTTVSRTLRGEDSVVLLPTGAGKSIAFQLAALLLPGRCIVVDPILSLIEDQLDNLRSYGIDRAVGLTSLLDPTQMADASAAMASGHFLFCYVAPERFQMVPFREALRQLTAFTPVSCIVIDEAHCVSEWGHDFRTAYLNLGRISRDYCESNGTTPPLVALTGTASRIVLKDVQRELGITAFDAIITPRSFDRPELHFSVVRCRSDEKKQRLLGFLRGLPTALGVTATDFLRPRGPDSVCGLIFCPHVNGEFGVVEHADFVRSTLGVPVRIYAGRPPNNVNDADWAIAKREAAHSFKRNETTVLVCTNAFGMGIDKANVRFTAHIGLPHSIEAFYQEAGRAGRNRARAECCIVLSEDNASRARHLLSPAAPLETIAEVDKKTAWRDKDDVIRALFFHAAAFKGQEAELTAISTMVSALGDIARQHRASVCWADGRWGGTDAKTTAEKALHRLLVLGVVSDYTVNYASRTFEALVTGADADTIATAYGRFVSAYDRRLGREAEADLRAQPPTPLRGFIEAAAARLVAFVYRHIEQARRRSLSEMLDAASRSSSDAALRKRILDYLQQTEWDEVLDALRTSPLAGSDTLGPILDRVASPTDAAALRGAVGRMLTSYPDVPNLLLVRAVAEALCVDGDPTVVSQNLLDAVEFARTAYRFPAADAGRAVGALADILLLREKADTADVFLTTALGSRHADREFARGLMQELPIQLAAGPAEWLNERLADRCATLCGGSATHA